MSDQVLRRLTEIADLGLEPERGRALQRLGDRVRAEIGAHDLATGPSSRPRRGAQRWLSGLIPLAATATTLAVVVIAVIFAGHGARVAPGARQSSTDSLLARLAVLRRPQQPQDRLPVRVHEQGRIIPSLTRLIATTHGVRIYLVVVAPDAVTREQWNPALGDLVSVIGVAHGNASQGPVLPAADLRDGTLTGTVGFRQNPRRAPTGRIGGPLYEVGVVPDGVTRVVWQAATGENSTGRRTIVPTVAGNLAYAPAGMPPALVVSARWSGAGGRPIATSDVVRRRAVAHTQTVMASREIRSFARFHYRADPALLSGFAVFAVHGRTPVRTASGQTISQPRLSALPPGIVSSVDPRQPAQPEPDQVRELITRTGIRVWIVPGARGLCVAAVTPALLPGGFGAAAGETCAPSVASALRAGIGFTANGPGTATNYRVLPRTITAVTVHGRRIPVPDGVLVTQQGKVR